MSEQSIVKEAEAINPEAEVKPRKWQLKFIHYKPGGGHVPGSVCHIFNLTDGLFPIAGGQCTLYAHDEFDAKIGRKHSFKRALKNVPDKISRTEIVEQFRADFPGNLEVPDYIMKQSAKARKVYLKRALVGAVDAGQLTGILKS